MNPSATASLARALALSLVLHAVLFVSGARILSALPRPARPADTPLEVRLAEPVSVPSPQPELHLPEDTAPKAAPAAKKRPRKPEVRTPRAQKPVRAPVAKTAPGGRRELEGAAAREAKKQLARELLYPPEAIARGLEGEAVVLLFLDEAGNAIAARIETSSGHPILDQAAVRAARTVRSLPASAPREALLPVRFRLQ